MKLQPVPVESNKRTLIGTVGYHLLRNHSVGPILLPDIIKIDWPDLVTIEEMNWGPIAIVQYFQTLETPFYRVVFLVALERENRKIGEIDVFQWQGGLPSEKQIQACIGDAATGVISIENLLVIGEFFKVWPKELYLVDVEPGPEAAGEFLTSQVSAKVPEILDTLRGVALNGVSAEDHIRLLRGDEIFREMDYGK